MKPTDRLPHTHRLDTATAKTYKKALRLTRAAARTLASGEPQRFALIRSRYAVELDSIPAMAMDIAAGFGLSIEAHDELDIDSINDTAENAHIGTGLYFTPNANPDARPAWAPLPRTFRTNRPTEHPDGLRTLSEPPISGYDGNPSGIDRMSF